MTLGTPASYESLSELAVAWVDRCCASARTAVLIRYVNLGMKYHPVKLTLFVESPGVRPALLLE